MSNWMQTFVGGFFGGMFALGALIFSWRGRWADVVAYAVIASFFAGFALLARGKVAP